MSTPVEVCMDRCQVSETVATLMVERDFATCEAVVGDLHDAWERADRGSCCKPVIEHADHYPPACEHLRRLWFARDYRDLARAKAPAGSFPCKCNGTGVFTGQRGGRNYTGVCFGCEGKGYQTPADRTRNDNYWNYFARVYA